MRRRYVAFFYIGINNYCISDGVPERPSIFDHDFLNRLPVFRRCFAPVLFENAVEVRYVVESAQECDFADRVGGFEQHFRGVAYAYVVDIIDDIPVRTFFEEMAEGRVAHRYQFGNVTQLDRVHIVVVDVFVDLCDSPAFRVAQDAVVVERPACQNPLARAGR